MLAIIKDWRQTLSWKLGYGRGKAGRAYGRPWWVDETVYALPYMQGKDVEIPSTKAAAYRGGLRLKGNCLAGLLPVRSRAAVRHTQKEVVP